MNPRSMASGVSWACSVAAALAVAALTVAALVGLQGDPLNATEQPDPAPDAATQPAEDADGTRKMEVVTVGLDMVTRAPIVLLREANGGRTLPVWVGVLEAQGIMRALHGVDMPRPMTHDLMATLLRELGGEVVQVTIDELRDATYYGKLVLRVRDEEELRIIDTRPSDAMALALRTGSPIYVANAVLQQTPEILFVPLDEGEQVVSALGITVIRPTPEHRQQFELPEERTGVLVVDVLGEAQRRGLQRGDLIIRIDDQTPASPMAFFEAIQAAAPGAVLQIRYLRGEKEHEIELPVEAPAPPAEPGRDVA
jgi:uncharacterized protein